MKFYFTYYLKDLFTVAIIIIYKVYILQTKIVFFVTRGVCVKLDHTDFFPNKTQREGAAAADNFIHLPR